MQSHAKAKRSFAFALIASKTILKDGFARAMSKKRSFFDIAGGQMQKASLFAFAFRSEQKLKLLLATANEKLRFSFAREGKASLCLRSISEQKASLFARAMSNCFAI